MWHKVSGIQEPKALEEMGGRGSTISGTSYLHLEGKRQEETRVPLLREILRNGWGAIATKSITTTAEEQQLSFVEISLCPSLEIAHLSLATATRGTVYLCPYPTDKETESWEACPVPKVGERYTRTRTQVGHQHRPGAAALSSSIPSRQEPTSGCPWPTAVQPSHGPPPSGQGCR